MPVSRRISDGELRERLEDHGYNVPPITDTTRAILIKKLGQLDTQRSKQVDSRRFTGLDYSSAEDEDAPTPIASSTRAGRNNHQESAVTSRVTRHTNGSSRSYANSRQKHASLMTHSEEEASDDDEEEEEEVEDEEEEEEESEDEEDVNVDRVDFAVQTSMLESPSPVSSSQRFRGQKLNQGSSFNHSGPVSPSQNNNYPSSTNTSGQTTFPIMSPYLRKNIKKHGSLNEALSTLPSKSKSSSSNPPSASSSPTSSSVTSQASPKSSSRNSSYNTSYSRESEGPCSYMLVSSLIIAVAAVFFLGLAVQYLSLQPPQPQSVIAVCGGLPGEIPGNYTQHMTSTLQKFCQVEAILMVVSLASIMKHFLCQ